MERLATHGRTVAVLLAVVAIAGFASAAVMIQDLRSTWHAYEIGLAECNAEDERGGSDAEYDACLDRIDAAADRPGVDRAVRAAWLTVGVAFALTMLLVAGALAAQSRQVVPALAGGLVVADLVAFVGVPAIIDGPVADTSLFWALIGAQIAIAAAYVRLVARRRAEPRRAEPRCAGTVTAAVVAALWIMPFLVYNTVVAVDAAGACRRSASDSDYAGFAEFLTWPAAALALVAMELAIAFLGWNGVRGRWVWMVRIVVLVALLGTAALANACAPR